MRGNAILLIIVTLICVGISVMLIPKKKDIAFLKLKSHDIEGARTALDEQLAQGDASVSVVASRTELALHDGDINTAVSVMENFVTANPDDAGAWRRLATYYRFNQQQLKYVETLAHIVRLDGTDEERHLLANLYRLYGQHDNLLKTLMDINKRGLANPKELAEAAELAAGTGNYRAAHAILHQLLDEHPDAINSHLLTMMVLLGEQLGERDHSVALLKRMAELDNGTKKIEPAINAAYERGNKPLSLALIKPLDGFIERSPVMLSLWSQIKLADGQHAVVLERLMTLEKEGKLPESSFSLLVQLLLDGRDLETVAELLENRDINILPDWQLTGIIDIAVEEQSRHMLTKVVDEVSEPFRDLHAVSYALALTGLGNLAAADTIAERVDQKLLKPSNIGRKPAERLRLSRLWFALARPERALTHLKLLARNRTASDDTYRVLTDLLIELQRYQDGLDLFNELRKTRPTPVIEVSWARLSAASGDDANVVKWLAKRTDLGVQSLTGLYFASGPDRAPKTGLLVAERLVNRQPDKLNRSRLATALLANGQYGRATTILKQLLPGDEQIRSAYADALVAQGRSQEAYKMLRQAFDSKLSSPQAANRLVSLAMDLGKTAEALALAQAAGLTRLRPVTIASLIEAVSLTGDTDTTDALIASIDPGILKTRPVLSARIAMALGRYDEAGEWVTRADQLPNLTPTERLDLAQIQLTRGEDTDALARLETLARSPDTPASAITDLAALYVKTDRVASGLPVLRSIAAKRSESSIGEARMVLEATGGDLETVNTWLQGPDVPTRQALLDIYYAAESRSNPTLINRAAKRLFDLYPGEDASLIRARTLVTFGKSREALPLLEELLPGNEQIRSLYADALIAQGRTRDAYEMLRQAFDGERSSPAAADRLVGMAMELGDIPTALKLAQETGLTRLQPSTMASLIEAVSLTGDQKATDDLLARINPAILNVRPILAARIAMALGRYDEAGEWVRRADELPSLTPTNRLDLAQIQLTRGEDADALRRLEMLARSPDTPATAITDLAALYVKTGQIDAGLATLRNVADTRPEPEIHEARMVLEAVGGDLGVATKWLRNTETLSRQALLDMYYAAENRADPTLANLAAEKLFALYPGDDATLIRARTLVQADKPRDALKLLENLLPGNAEVRSVYITALARSGQTEDLKAYAQSALSDPNLPPAQRDTILYALVNANEPAQALPSLKKLATEDPAKWQETYINALASAGSPDQLKAYGAEALKNPDIPPRAREALVYALLNIQAHDTVVPTLRSLAKSDPDKWQGTYIAALAGEKYTGERTRLLIRRLKQVRPGPDRDQLLYDLLATAGPETALPYLRKRAARKNAGPWTATYVQALRDLGRKKELIGYYRKRSLAKGLPAKERREAAFVLLEMNARRDAENAFLQLAATAEPTSPDVQQLLYLWGPRPPKSAREWLHKRAATAPRRERIKWLRLLNQTGEFRTLAATPDNKLPKSMTDRSTPAYVEAMQQARDLPKLRRFLDRIARTAETRKEQLRLAEWAEQANHPALASSLFQKLANRKNASAETLFRAGQAQFFASKYRAAIPILDRYLKQVNGKPDPRAPFYRAQSHAALRRPDRASADFARTLQLLGPKEPANLELRRIRVQSLVGTRQFEKAVAAYERLLKDAPDNQDIRADFAALLIEIGELDKAELLLASK